MGYLFGLIPLFVLIVWLVGAVRLASRGHVLCGVLVGIGILGFVAPLFLPLTGAWLQQIELPASFETTSILGPGDRTFTATIPTARVQRYIDGRFETGWFVHSAGGMFSIGLTADGRIAIAAARTKQIEFFNPDGSSAGAPQSCIWSGSHNDGVLRPSDCWVNGVVFLDPVQTGHPGMHWATLVLFPLWHPFVAWLLAGAGLLGAKITSEPRVRVQTDRL
ncbi:hypothetical protein IC762_33700 [Bradyrhizobium genosp. L]|uniref:hypothetical protein n=1 Tax=Bradyrhizobium genosp. L TaxID=83637 RepID=UPI0018A32612|nr:hypothetical protein [Bradyrhizobium genosp. L]QPF84503.1 hypothetical protein IC762_33700 [Bradyrhizobium genosp. L]